MTTAPQVLVIDDDPAFLDPFRDLLATLGIDADYETTWDAGLATFRAGQHLLVIADYNLPESPNGLRLLGAIKVLNKACRLVLISGQFGAERRAEVEELVDRFMEKTADLEAIVEEARAAAERAAVGVDWRQFAQDYRKRPRLAADRLDAVDSVLRRAVGNGKTD